MLILKISEKKPGNSNATQSPRNRDEDEIAGGIIRMFRITSMRQSRMEPFKNGYFVGKYIRLEKQIEKSKDRYYDTL